MRDLYAEFETATLPNGLTVYHLHWPDRAGVRFEFLIHSGARHDPVGKEGVAHFMEHLVSENAMIPAEDLRRFFEHNAGEHPRLGSTSFNGTWYGFLSSADKALLSQSLTYYGHMLLQTSLVKEVERERQVIFSEYDREYPMQIKFDVNRRLRDAVFYNTFFSRSLSPLGTKETIGSISQPDMQEFYDTNYTPANMSVVVVGELTLAEAVDALLNSPFGEYRPGVRTPHMPIIREVPLPTETEFRLHQGAHTVGVESASFLSTAQLPGTVTQTQIRIVREMLQTQLFKVVRLENAWTYHIGCSNTFFGDFNDFDVICSSFDMNAMGSISDVVSDCIESLRTQPTMFEEAKRKLIATKHFVDLNMRGVAKDARNDLLHFGRILTLTEELRAAEEIQMDDILPVLDHLRSERRWTMIGYP
ncbi:MAG: hypothetical protein RLZZ480_18 [Candidatus Parcubacteria bacterium]